MDPLQTPSEPPVSTPPAPEAPAPAPGPTPAPEAPTPPVAAATTPAAPGSNTFSIVALILAFVFSPVGLIMGIVALMKSKKAGQKNNLALAAIIIGGLGTVGEILLIISLIALAANSTTITTY